MKTELLNQIAEVVAKECEVTVAEIKSTCKRGDIVEARCMFVHYCYVYGLQPASISKFLCRSRKNTINDCCYNYQIMRKQSFSFRLMSSKVEKILADMYPRE